MALNYDKRNTILNDVPNFVEMGDSWTRGWTLFVMVMRMGVGKERLSRLREHRVAPPGLELFLPLLPALKCVRENLCRPLRDSIAVSVVVT